MVLIFFFSLFYFGLKCQNLENAVERLKRSYIFPPFATCDTLPLTHPPSPHILSSSSPSLHHMFFVPWLFHTVWSSCVAAVLILAEILITSKSEDRFWYFWIVCGLFLSEFGWPLNICYTNTSLPQRPSPEQLYYLFLVLISCIF